TPAIQDALGPLQALEIAAARQYEEELRESDCQEIVREEIQKDIRAKIRKAIKDGNEQGAAALADEIITESASAQTRRRYVVNDCTIEKLGEILQENPNGVVIYRDEITGWLRSLHKEGQECARSFYLEAWNGTGHYTYDRIGRGTVDIEAAIVSV